MTIDNDEKFIKNMMKCGVGMLLALYLFAALCLGGVIYFAIWALKHFGVF